MVAEDVSGGYAVLNNNEKLPLVGFGTYKIATQDEVNTAVDAALSSGYRMFDTAKYYNNEDFLGHALKEYLPRYNLKREDIFITTKTFPDRDDTFENGKNHVLKSLKDLQTEYIDLYLIHYPKSDFRENDDPMNAYNRKELYLALVASQKAGLIKSIGVSNYEVRHLREIPSYSDVVPAVNQLEFHPLFTRNDIREYCKQHNIFFQAFSSLARFHEDVIKNDVIVKMAEKYSVTVPILLLAFAVCQNVGIIPKSSSPARIKENFKVVDVKISKEDIRKLMDLDTGKHYIRCTPWLVTA
uniref:Aldo_ket_red domain-containing protein n=1 Tax=Rhabditophanes sp. KR3021 TaxID=114890 RepID=A0AC35U686_9BILA